jgi:hypothetical protein
MVHRPAVQTRIHRSAFSTKRGGVHVSREPCSKPARSVKRIYAWFARRTTGNGARVCFTTRSTSILSGILTERARDLHEHDERDFPIRPSREKHTRHSQTGTFRSFQTVTFRHTPIVCHQGYMTQRAESGATSAQAQDQDSSNKRKNQSSPHA